MRFAQFYLHIVYFILLDPAFKKEEFNKQVKSVMLRIRNGEDILCHEK